MADLVGEYYADLAGHIMAAYPWGEKYGPLANFHGPERWVFELADDISNQVAMNKFDGVHPVPVIYVGVASGNGCAKSTTAAMIADWIKNTRPFCQGTVTANTGDQLRTKTWREMTKWNQMSITSDWFDIRAETIRHKQHGSQWAVNMLRWSLENTQAFAGQHSRESTSFYIFDEASHIPEEVMEQADGGLTDGEAMWFMFGNPTNRQGRLFRAVFGNLKWTGEGTPPPGEYISKSIDSRDCEFTNKDKIKKWEKERGEDSDWFRSHVKGLAPNSDEAQYIDNERARLARTRILPETDATEPLVMSLDFARGGSAWNVLGFRRGRDARSIPRTRIPGEKTRDTTYMFNIICHEIDTRKPDYVMGDATGIGGPIMDRVRARYPQTDETNPRIIDVVNGGSPPDDHPKKPSRFGNWRAYCYGHMREWLPGGCIEDDDTLADQICEPGFWHDTKDRIMIESKEDMQDRGVMSPDDADQLAMTFAIPVLPKNIAPRHRPTGANDRAQQAARTKGRSGSRGWMRR